jgi:hypothetical protein
VKEFFLALKHIPATIMLPVKLIGYIVTPALDYFINKRCQWPATIHTVNIASIPAGTTSFTLRQSLPDRSVHPRAAPACFSSLTHCALAASSHRAYNTQAECTITSGGWKCISCCDCSTSPRSW